MNNPLLAFAGLLLLTGCGGFGRGGPDGGSDRIVCTDGIQALTVTVKDSSGAVVKGATVTARHSGTGTTVTSTTNDQGIATAVTSESGSGSIQLSAREGTRASTVAQVDWLCGECSCTATPTSTTLTIQ